MLRRVFPRLCGVAATAKAAEAGAPAKHMTQQQLDDLSPRDIVKILDAFIVGQTLAKKAVAISLRNRWRRRQIKDDGLRGDILPKNILMIGPTGVGKTEISRRMARITDAPFVKVEATKYTEVGFKGKDVESMIEDLYNNARTKARRRLERERDAEAQASAMDIVFSAYVRQHGSSLASDAPNGSDADTRAETPAAAKPAEGTPRPRELTLEEFESLIAAGDPIKDKFVRIEVTVQPERKGSPGMGEIFMLAGPQTITQTVVKTVQDAIPLTKTEVLGRLIDDSQVTALAKELTESEGIIFLDEIDKVVSTAGQEGADVSSLGVQQDLLPLIEGSTVTVKDGTTIQTDAILFICSGAFHLVKPSDMIAELQGRLPVRVELQALNEAEFRRILVEPRFNLLAQQQAMLKVEGIDLSFSEDGIDAIASITARVNSSAQNIGARRLHTIIEMVVDEYSFDCDKYADTKVVIDANKVNEATKKLLGNVDLSRYIM